MVIFKGSIEKISHPYWKLHLKAHHEKFEQAETQFWFRFNLLLKIVQKSVSAEWNQMHNIGQSFYFRHKMGKERILIQTYFKSKKSEFKQIHESRTLLSFSFLFFIVNNETFSI